MQKKDVPNLVIFVWKYGLIAVCQAVFVLWGQSTGPPTWRCLCSCWKWLLISALCTTGAALTTMSNLETTSVSALLFFYAAPLWALVMGFIMLREVLLRRTIVAVLFALTGVALLFVPSVLNFETKSPPPTRDDGTVHSASLRGDVLGLISGLCMAGYLTTCRHATLFKPEVPLILGAALGSLWAAMLGGYLALHQGHELFALPSGVWPLLAADTVGIGVYFVMSSFATAYLPGSEVAFLLLIEVILAPLLVGLVYGEVPSAVGISGAALLAAAVLGHEFAAMREDGGIRSPAHPRPPTVGAHPKKLRVSDADLLSRTDMEAAMASATEVELSAMEAQFGLQYAQTEEERGERATLLGGDVERDPDPDSCTSTPMSTPMKSVRWVGV